MKFYIMIVMFVEEKYKEIEKIKRTMHLLTKYEI